jgi:Fe-S-cluster containining protein
MSPCTSCHAGCCRSFAVPVTGADILRIERDCGLPLEEFACRWEDTDGAIARDRAPHFRFSDAPQTRFVICLKHDASDSFPGTTRCRFLREGPPELGHPLGIARCGIYAGRPAACRTFPAKLSQTGELAILAHVPVRGRAGEHPAYELCPRDWQPADLDPIDAVQELVVARFETEFFTQFAELWNRRPRPWEAFPAFLRMAYSGRVQLAERDLERREAA